MCDSNRSYHQLRLNLAQLTPSLFDTFSNSATSIFPREYQTSAFVRIPFISLASRKTFAISKCFLPNEIVFNIIRISLTKPNPLPTLSHFDSRCIFAIGSHIIAQVFCFFKLLSFFPVDFHSSTCFAWLSNMEKMTLSFFSRLRRMKPQFL